LESLPQLPAIAPPAPRVLTVGNRSGVLGQVACEVLGAETTAHTFDIHHFRGMEPHVLAAFRKRFHPICSANLPDDETYDVVLFQLNRGNLTTELVQDMVQQAVQRLKPGGRLVCAIQGQALWLMRRLQTSFRNVQSWQQSHDISLLTATDCKGTGKAKSFRCELLATFPQGIQFPLVTYPGVFAHRQIDAGGQALAETMDVVAADRVLDMGCGNGLIGIAAAKLAPLERLVLIDSHARAIQAARENVEMNGLEALAEVIQSEGRTADFGELQGQFSLFVGNPPYYSQNQVTSRFVELAHQVLDSRGRAWFVTKNPEWLGKEIERHFGEVQFFSRRQYTLLRSVKS
jgi:16S rRNA G1207 methylase RsmC